MKKHGLIASALVALSLMVMALPMAAMADEAGEVDDSAAFYASNICPATEDGKHVYVRVTAEDATCTQEGHTRGLSCSACGEVFIESTVIPKKEHEFTVAINEVPATCTEAGTTGGWQCANCDATKGVTEIPALNHDWDNEVTVEATCTSDGKVTHTCKRCNLEETVRTLPATGHDWQKVDGSTHKCSKCGAEESHSFVDGKCGDCGYRKSTSGGGSSSGSHSSGSSAGLDNVPKTGDVTPVYAYGIVMLLGIAAILVRRFRLAK